uniref:Pathogenesis-related protein 1 n=2 Tax=Gymnema sylvestre TaxID=4068 RepID=A0A976RUK2_GYMSY|nr:pathogenesis-related protein 1 [Gymnema sylvestre]
MGMRLALGICVTSLLLAIWFPSALAQNSVQDYLDAHNAARAQVGVGPMSWDNELAAYALKYANSQMGNCPNLVHSGGPYGENLAAGGGEFTGRQAVDLWVKEKQFYDYGSNTCRGSECLHYTQVVWRDSVRLGCARVRCSNNTWWYVICSYAPRGNIVGRRPY